MADSVNKVMLIGRAGKEPDVRFAQNGVATAKFSLATTARWTTDKGEKKEETTWHRITIFGKRAESVSKYIFKGTYLRVEGSIKNGKYTNDKGIDIYTSEIVCREIGFLSTKDENEKLAQQPTDGEHGGSRTSNPRPPKPNQQRTSTENKTPNESESSGPPEDFQELGTGGDDDIPF